MIRDTIVGALGGVSEEVGVVILGAMPVAELRGAIPVGIEVWGLPVGVVFVLAVLGNLIPLIPLYFGLDALRNFVERWSPRLLGWLDRYIERSKRKMEKRYEVYGALALLLFTAIPFPLTGLYSATVASVALKVPFRVAGPAIVGGVLIAGVVMTILTVGLGSLT